MRHYDGDGGGVGEKGEKIRRGQIRLMCGKMKKTDLILNIFSG